VALYSLFCFGSVFERDRYLQSVNVVVDERHFQSNTPQKNFTSILLAQDVSPSFYYQLIYSSKNGTHGSTSSKPTDLDLSSLPSHSFFCSSRVGSWYYRIDLAEDYGGLLCECGKFPELHRIVFGIMCAVDESIASVIARCIGNNKDHDLPPVEIQLMSIPFHSEI
jgi:hypothetical protein